jgi:hypothetical protein
MAITVPRRGNVPTHTIPTDPSNPATAAPGNPNARRKRHQRFVSRGGVVSPAPGKGTRPKIPAPAQPKRGEGE